jgi:hypothetical protein
MLNTLGPALSLTSHAAILQLETRIVEIAKLPTEEQGRQLQQPDLFAKENYPYLAQLYLVPRVQKETSDLYQVQASSQAALRATLAAVAAERYRRIHGTWPESLGALVPDFLAKVPLDPYDGQPLRLRHRDPGLVIYSVGPDGHDDDGNLDRTKPKGPGTDVGTQLWEVAQRRQPPKP